MKKITFYIEYGEDFVFKSGLTLLLKDKYQEIGYDIGPQTTHPPQESEFTLYVDMPTKMPPKNQVSYVILAEPPVIFSRNYKKSNFKHFKKVFTWHDGFVDNKKIIKLNYPQEVGPVDFDLSKKNRLCCLIARNKHSRRKGELFSKRLEAIRWFEKNAPGEFDLFGPSWGEGVVEHRWLFDIKTPTPKNYLGKLGDKIETLKYYKFSIAYENWLNDAGYITEKIFDCFSASTVPVYLGATNIEKYIPKDCFIDKREFKTYDELYSYMKNMGDEEYLKYLKNIDSFLKSDKMKAFSQEVWIDTIVKGTLN